jgi:hypothetical protein
VGSSGLRSSIPRGLRLLATEVDNGVVSAGIVFDNDTLSSMARVSSTPISYMHPR